MALFDHQFDGAQWLADRKRAYLADEPGLGKTRTLIRGLQLVGSHKPLIVAPAIVRSHWLREFEECSWDGERPVIVSYDWIVRRGEAARERLIHEDAVDALVLDEAHYLKNTDARRTKLLLGKDSYARRLPTVWAASGTPMPKHPGELWAIVSTLFPSVVSRAGFQTREQWMDHFTVRVHTEFGEKVVAVKNVDELRQLLSRVMLRRTLDDVGLDVPPVLWSVRSLDVKDINPEIFEIEAKEDVETAFRLGLYSESLATYRRLVGEAKARPIALQLIEELEGTEEKIVVFSHHRSVLEVLEAHFNGENLQPAYIDGDVPQAKRDAEIERFQTDPACRVFLGQTIACQTGITLTAARRVILVEPDWTGVVNVQAAHRVARIGQKAEHCFAQLVSLAGTLDDAIVRNHAKESQRVEEILLLNPPPPEEVPD